MNKLEKLQEAANTVIKAFDTELTGLKRSNSLTVLAEDFNRYEAICLELVNKGISTASFTPGMKVVFIKTKEKGVVSSINDRFVFVKFDHLIPDTGLDDMIGQACSPEHLIIL